MVGPKGLTRYCQKEYFRTHTRPNTFKIKVKEINKSLKFKKFVVECIKTIHSENSVAYKFKEQDKSLVISGDCDFDENLVKFSKNSDILLLECSFPNSMKVEGHLIPKECGLIAKNAGVKKLILTHLYPTSPEIIRLRQTKRIFKNTILARDLMKIKI